MIQPILKRTALEEGPSAQLSVLSKSDGSASWTDAQGSAVISSVNGPMEVRIRDEVLGEATLDLKILPLSGLAGTRERYMENTIRSALRPALLLGLHPRSLIQITSQVVSAGRDIDGPETSLDTIASIINSIVLAAVDAGISMSCILAAAVVKAPEHGRHVACYSFPKHDLLMLESQGPFKREQLPLILESALKECISVHDTMREKIEEKVTKDNRWRGD